MDDHNTDIDLGLDLGTDSVGVDLTDLDDNWKAALTVDDADDISIDGENYVDNADILLDLEGTEDVDLDATTLLQTRVDMSKEFLKYHAWTVQALQKIEALFYRKPLEFPMPPYTDFSFIPNKAYRQMVYGFFCEMMKDLCGDERYVQLDEEQAFRVMLDELFQGIHFTPSVHYSTLRRIFTTYYENNKKLSRVYASSREGSVADLVDLERVKKAELVFAINSYAFDIVSRFFSDPNLVNQKATIKPSEFGDFTQEMRQALGTNNIRHRDVYNFIASFLQSPDVVQSMQLTDDESLSFSTGELLRRYVVQELNDGSFYPMGLKNFKGGAFTNEAASMVITSLSSAMQKQSFAAEVLYLVMTLMYAMPDGERGYDEFFRPFVMNLGRFLSAFAQNKAYVNPVFYSFIGKAEQKDGNNTFELGYAEGERSYIVECPDILFEVVGDNNNIYHIPLVYLDESMNSVLCPPPEVVNGVRKLSPSGRVNINGNITYQFVPSFAWLSSLSLASDMDTSEEHYDVSGIGQDNNPLLDVLLHYTNKFDMSGEQPTLVSVESDIGPQFIGLRTSVEKPLKVLELQESGTRIPIERGQAVVDSQDNSIIVRYIRQDTPGEQIILLHDGEYKATLISNQDNTEVNTVAVIDSLFGRVQGDYQDIVNPYSQTIVSRICSLNALNYKSMLEDARVIVARDLLQLLDANVIDQMLGLKAIDAFVDLIEKQEGRLDGFNLGTLRELLDFVAGEPNVLTDVEELTPKVVQGLKDTIKACQEKAVTIDTWLKHFDELDIHTLALQSCSRSELQDYGEKALYYVLHAIPACHARLRMLEDQLVLARALKEIDTDIIPVLRKNSTIFTAYNTVCTADSVQRVEATLHSGMRVSSIPPCLYATRNILFNDFPENCAIVKYFVLDHNAYGTLTELEECFTKGNTRYEGLYKDFKEFLGIQDVEQVRMLSEEEFASRVPRDLAMKGFSMFHQQFIKLCIDGLIAEASSSLNIEMLKAFDILTAYGQYLFNLPDDAMEDFSDVSEFIGRANEYIGSFLVTYSPIVGEAADEIDGGFDRYSAYLRHRKDFLPIIPLEQFASYTLRDLKLVVNTENADTIAEAGDSDHGDQE